MVATRIQVYIILMTMFTGKYYFFFVKLYVHSDCIERVVSIQTACLYLLDSYIVSRDCKGRRL